MEAQRVLRGGEGRGQFMGALEAAPVDDHHDLFPGFAERGHDLREIVAALRGITVRPNFLEDLGGAIVDRADDAEHHPTRDATPRAIRQSRVACEGFIAVDLTLAQGAGIRARGCASPARAGQGETPEARFVCREQKDLTAARLVFERGEFKRTVGESSRGGLQAACGAVEASRVFLKILRTRARPSRTPV